MYKKIEIDGKSVGLVANAATPFRFKQVFKNDLFAILGNEEKAMEQGVESVAELCYIMAKQAEITDMNKLNYEGFLDWLEDFGPMAFINSAEEILTVYMDSLEGASTP